MKEVPKILAKEDAQRFAAMWRNPKKRLDLQNKLIVASRKLPVTLPHVSIQDNEE